MLRKEKFEVEVLLIVVINDIIALIMVMTFAWSNMIFYAGFRKVIFGSVKFSATVKVYFFRKFFYQYPFFYYKSSFVCTVGPLSLETSFIFWPLLWGCVGEKKHDTFYYSYRSLDRKSVV